MLPFYFLFELPTRSDRGLVLLQRFRVFGVRKAFVVAFSSWFGQRYQDLVLEVARIVPPEAWREYADGRVVELKFLAAQLPTAIEDAYIAENFEKPQAAAEFSVRVRRNGALPRRLLAKVQEAVRGERAFDQIVELPGIDVARVRVVVEKDGTKRTLEIGSLEKLRVTYDITDEVEIDSASGLLTVESLDREARAILGDIKKEIGAVATDAD